MKEKKHIRVYADEGVYNTSLNATLHCLTQFANKRFIVETISAPKLKTKDWEDDTTLLVFPGGRDTPYHHHLKGDPCNRIRDFLSNGGKYLGICAGAYFASKNFTFEKGGPLEILAERELHFFPGMAEGPALGLNRFAYTSQQGAEAACILLSKDNIKTHIYYNGGCHFVNAALYPNVKVHAHYEDRLDKSAAIISCKVGEGTALLSGVHFEMCPNFLHFDNEPLATKKSLFLKSEEKRQKLCEYLLRELSLLD